MYPRLFQWLHDGPLPWLAYLVPFPGVMHAMVVVALGVVFVRRLARVGIPRQPALEAVLLGTAGALVFTRVFYLVTRTRFWEMPLAELVDGARGTASWGAYLGAVVGLWVWARWQRVKPLVVMDVAASTAALACVVGRWNCFLIGDDFGRPTTLPWGVAYPARSLPWKAHVARGWIEPDAVLSLPVHPNQLFLSGAALLTFLLTSWFWYRHQQQPGQTLALFFVTYGATRFPIEFLRDPAGGGATGILSHSQYMCLAFVAGGLLLWGAGRARGGQLPEGAVETALRGLPRGLPAAGPGRW